LKQAPLTGILIIISPIEENLYLKNVRDDGVFKGLKKWWKQVDDDAMRITPYDNDGNIMGFETFFKHQLKRTGELDPSKNIVKVVEDYTNLLLDFKDNQLQTLNLPQWTTTFQDPYVDTTILLLKGILSYGHGFQIELRLHFFKIVVLLEFLLTMPIMMEH